mmetsp:Transcript_6269/g.17543  ORF Transcript_6269/g.17543 Transcript_6269/m.17543 type:complete len:354 (-) Transcript_6269:294-1355(-)|eukprot:CAMPEP_0117661634 /NCGR_PEP_ID=MMETSP0804-20121206/7641_1 /TAXON_ID=1074897 /ORGANISM="Tetraselmis astigmatica, Strain CCMP880" /LENGTH=353 /DNA_ID=CAMNT_0005468513 /DNA_START=90 /DNA_END=1151 /DNA_ORIENTATION=-
MQGSIAALPRGAAVLSNPRRPAGHLVRRGRPLRMSCRAAALEEPEVMIRRRPPSGITSQNCGEMKFQVPEDEENKPRNILEEIVWFKAQELEDMRHRHSTGLMMAMAKAAPPPRDYIGALRAAGEATGRPGLIAEVKKASPSKGVIQPNFDPVKIAKGYEQGGAACLSVLTDRKYFQGGFENLKLIREAGVQCPLLCKEFVVDAYQMFAARANGADAILLIAAVLPNSDLEYMLKVAKQVGLQCLIEVHTVTELTRVLKLGKLLDPELVFLGINNRDLTTFEITLENTRVVMESNAGKEVLNRGLLMTGESGIFTSDDVAFVQKVGVGAILVGESIVKQDDTKAAVKNLLGLN